MTAKTGPNRQADSIYPIYVIYGKVRHLAVNHLSAVTDQVLAGTDRQLALISYEPGAEWADVHDDLHTLPFLSPRRLVVIRDADAFITEHRQRLEKYLEAPCETGVLVLMPESFPSNTRLAKDAKKIGQVINCEPIKPHELSGYLVGEAKSRHNLTLLPAAAGLLVELGGDDSARLLTELEKIATFLAGDAESVVTPEHVEALVGSNRQLNVFQVIDAMTDMNARRALFHLDRLFGQDRDAQFTAVGAFAWHVRRLYRARVLLDRRADHRTIIKELRIWSQADQFIQQVKRLSLERIGAMLHDLMALDWVSKTGAGSVQAGLEKIIVLFCRSRRGVA